VGPEEPAPRAVGPLQRAQLQGREHPRLPDLELDRDRRLAVHRARAAGPAVDLLRPPPPGRSPQRRPAAGDRGDAGEARRRGREPDGPLSHRRRHHLHAPVESDADTVARSSPKRRSRRSPSAAPPASTTRPRTRRWNNARRKAISDVRDRETPPEAIPDNGLLRFLTCGSVDDGKSTLIGRLLFDSKTILADTLHAIQRTSAKRGLDASTCRC
jgi:hypothetical protein